MKKFNNKFPNKNKRPRTYRPPVFPSINYNELHPAKINTSETLAKSFTGRSVSLRPGEEFESLLKRFKRTVESAGILTELKKREYFKSDGVKAREDKMKAIKRAKKRQALNNKFDQ